MTEPRVMGTCCPACRERLVYAPEGGQWAVWCPSRRCPSAESNEGVRGPVLSLAAMTLTERIQIEMKGIEDEE